MVTINLNDKSAGDVKAIMKLREMGIPDEQIQKWYDNSRSTEKGEER